MGKIILVRLGHFRPTEAFDQNDVECDRDDYVILDVERGTEFGKVVSHSDVEMQAKPPVPKGKVLRRVTEGDWNQIKNNENKAQDSINVCVRKVNERKLNMQIVQSEYAFDCSKIIFFFTAEGRVDFRSLVKDLAKIFRVRIELKQIGVRDKAKIVGGYGVCGRELCCSSFINHFQNIPINMAKEQSLPLNPTRISGVCNKVKCCMAYEFQVYREYAKELPHVGEKISTPEGKGRVKEVNILKKVILVDFGEGRIKRMNYVKEDGPAPAES